MSKLSPEKRNHLILALLITAVVLIGLIFGLIRFQQEGLESLASRKRDAQSKLDKIELAIKNADRLEQEVAEVTRKLADLEDDMAPSGDPLSWMVSKIRLFKLPYKVEIPQISSPEPDDKSYMAKFPYKQVKFTIGGTAFFHDFGKFLADFENHFPYFRVVNIDLQPAPPSESERYKLVFKMEIVTLVKPGAS